MYVSRAPAISMIRNQSVPGAVAGIYNPCRTMLNEHRPVCTKEYHLTGKYLDGADNPDVWFPIPGAGGGTVVYSSRFLTLKSGTGAASASRCVIDQAKFPINANFIEVTCRIGTYNVGAGGTRWISIGFQPAFSAYATNNRAIFAISGQGASYVAPNGSGVPIASLNAGDVITVRLDRVEGSADINIARYYVNGRKVHETALIPTENCYAGIGVFSDASTTTAASIAIDYFGVKYVP